MGDGWHCYWSDLKLKDAVTEITGKMTDDQMVGHVTSITFSPSGIIYSVYFGAEIGEQTFERWQLEAV